MITIWPIRILDSTTRYLFHRDSGTADDLCIFLFCGDVYFLFDFRSTWVLLPYLLGKQNCKFVGNELVLDLWLCFDIFCTLSFSLKFLYWNNNLCLFLQKWFPWIMLNIDVENFRFLHLQIDISWKLIFAHTQTIVEKNILPNQKQNFSDISSYCSNNCRSMSNFAKIVNREKVAWKFYKWAAT